MLISGNIIKLGNFRDTERLEEYEERCSYSLSCQRGCSLFTDEKPRTTNGERLDAWQGIGRS